MAGSTAIAQVKSKPAKAPTKKSKTQESIKIQKYTLPNDTATITGLNVEDNRVKAFNPSNSKIKNLPVKTPVYQPIVTGTNGPGDGRMGIPVQSNNRIRRSTYPVAVDSLKSKINGQ